MSDEKRSEYKKTHRERRMRRKSEQGAIQHIPNHDQMYTWRHMKKLAGSIGEIWEKIKIDFMWRQVNQEATLGEMKDLCDQSCINPLCEGGNRVLNSHMICF
uniref:Uncharacterized protein n=1 Tax=Setaria viridis TaxID=4556 RepID=A0A4U6TUS9_SETVI|nr:hypothetical protein SEVIR_7G209000v2 [Setaria viridis]